MIVIGYIVLFNDNTLFKSVTTIFFKQVLVRHIYDHGYFQLSIDLQLQNMQNHYRIFWNLLLVFLYKYVKYTTEIPTLYIYRDTHSYVKICHSKVTFAAFSFSPVRIYSSENIAQTPF